MVSASDGRMLNLRRHGNAVAVIMDDGVAIDHRGLSDRCDDWAAQIDGRSVVFILSDNTLPALIGLVACLEHGIVFLVLDARIDERHLLGMIRAYEPDYLWRPSAGGGYALERLNRTPGGGERLAPHPELAMLLATSGSTGSPKVVRIGRENVLANVHNHISILGLRPDDRYLALLPFDHTYGLSMLLSHLYAGASVLISGKTVMERGFWDFLEAAAATVIGGVPCTYELFDRLMFFERDFPALRLLTLAGGKPSDELHVKLSEYADRTGKRFIAMYGQSEATALIAYLPSEFALRKIGAIGVPIAGGETWLVDEDGKTVLEAGKSGELMFSGPTVSLGYATDRSGLARGDERHGVLATGDLAKRDSDGCYYIVGRKSRFLKVCGHRVDLDAVERMVAGMFPGVECACTGEDDRVCVFFTGDCAGKSIVDFVSRSVNLPEGAFSAARIAAIPRSSSGKILYGALAQAGKVASAMSEGGQANG